MTRHATIAEFTAAVADRTPEGFDLVTTTCERDPETEGGCGECEPCNHAAEFTWRPCETCGSDLGGDRHPMAYINPPLARGEVPGDPADSIRYVSGCSDCLFYVANGDLPDHLPD